MKRVLSLLLALVLALGVGLPIATVALAAPTGTWSTTGSMSTARYINTATLLANGKVLVAGGYDGSNGTLSSAELYDPTTGIWSAAGSMSTARYINTATLLANGKVLVAGGYDGSNYLSSAELYDPTTGIWSAAGSMSTARDYHTATLLANGKVLVAGGWGSNGTLSSAELYDPTTGSWSAADSMSTARYNHTATLLANGKVLVAGGWGSDWTDNGRLSSAELYDPTTGSWSAAGSMSNTRCEHTATLLANGSVLVAGGLGSLVAGGYGSLSSAERYDPTTGSWSAAGSMSTARWGHTATLLANGSVLVVAGVGGHNDSLSSAERYDPKTGSWSAAGSMGTDRYHHTATLLSNGSVLVAGGIQGASFLSSAELYTPQENVLTSGNSKIWVGLKNSDEVGAKFDLKAEVYNGALLVGSGEVLGVSAGSSGFNNARLSTINITPVPGAYFNSGDTLSLTLLVRKSGSRYSPTARLWYDGNSTHAKSSFDVTIGNNATTYYLHSSSTLSTSVGTGNPGLSIDVGAIAAGGPYKSFGTWSITLP